MYHSANAGIREHKNMNARKTSGIAYLTHLGKIFRGCFLDAIMPQKYKQKMKFAERKKIFIFVAANWEVANWKLDDHAEMVK